MPRPPSPPAAASPRVTVFVAVHDRAPLVGAAIRSVLEQDFRDLELLVVDDGSTDGSAEEAERFGDRRVRVVRQPERLGIPRTRNHGLELARGEYLAILDSDDVALPGRLRRQVAFLDAHPEVAAVGGWATRVRADGRFTTPALRPTRPREIRARIAFASCFKNPTMTARTDVLRAFRYREDLPFCQDIELWGRISTRHPLANLPAFVTRYRLGGESRRDPALAGEMKRRAVADRVLELGVEPGPGDLDRHLALRNPARARFGPEDLDWCEAWLVRLIEANRHARRYPEPEFSRAAAERWWLAGLAASPRAGWARLRRPRLLGSGLPAALASPTRLLADWVRGATGSRGAAGG